MFTAVAESLKNLPHNSKGDAGSLHRPRSEKRMSALTTRPAQEILKVWSFEKPTPAIAEKPFLI